MSSFEMAISYIFPTYQIVLKWTKTDLSKIQIAVFSKVLIENSSSLNMLSWKCIGSVDQEESGRGLPIHSALSDKKSQNFFLHFWVTLCLDWMKITIKWGSETFPLLKITILWH